MVLFHQIFWGFFITIDTIVFIVVIFNIIITIFSNIIWE